MAEPSKLLRAELKALEALDAGNCPFISDFSLWEVATLAALGRLDLDQPFADWLLLAAQPGIVRILPFTVEIAIELASLPDALHRDPADRAIVATARVHRLPVMTRDRKILSSDLVQSWRR